jgi:uncharacterized protein YceK
MIPSKMALLVTIFVLACLSGCGTRVVLIPPGEPIRLREPVKAKIWAADKNGVEVPGEVVIPEGYWALPDSGPAK